MLTDSATLTGGFNPTGTITFTLTHRTAPPARCGRRSPSAATAPTTRQLRCRPRQVGHLPVGRQLQRRQPEQRRHRTHGTNESVTTVKASPTISTTASQTAAAWWARRRAERLGDAVRRLQPDRHDHLHADTRRHHRRWTRRRSGQRRRHLHTRRLRCRPRQVRHLQVGRQLQRRQPNNNAVATTARTSR